MPETCAAATLPPRPGKPDGSVCREWDPVAEQPGWASGGPLCDTELRVAERDTRALLWDYLDLEQALPRSLSQAMDGQPSGKPGPPVPLALAPDVLQAEIVHVLTTWEEQVRARCRLSPLPTYGRAAPWHTTDSNRPPLARVRGGAAVQRATTILAPRIDALARIEPVTVFRAGTDGDAEDVAGWEAVLHLSRLHARARSLLGRTHRTEHLPGDCSHCGAADLRRDEPRFAADSTPVYCGGCATSWTREEYDRYVLLMLALPIPSAVPA